MTDGRSGGEGWREGIGNVRARQKEARNVIYKNKITYSFLFFLFISNPLRKRDIRLIIDNNMSIHYTQN